MTFGLPFLTFFKITPNQQGAGHWGERALEDFWKHISNFVANKKYRITIIAINSDKCLHLVARTSILTKIKPSLSNVIDILTFEMSAPASAPVRLMD